MNVRRNYKEVSMGWCSGTQIFDDVAAALLDENNTKTPK